MIWNILRQEMGVETQAIALVLAFGTDTKFDAVIPASSLA